MKIGNTRTLCKKGKHGVCDHGIYSYGNSIRVVCLECTRERKRERYKDSKKRKHDREYSRNWCFNNKDHVSAQLRERAKRNKREKDKLVKKFLDKNKEKINKLLEKIESALSFSDIEKHCYHFNIVLFMPIKRLIVTNKRNELLRREQYRQSAYTKHSWGVRNNYSNISEVMKEKIKAEYMLNAKKIVDKKMKELCQKI